jgi:hypothetical protein
MKLYTEEQVIKAIELARDTHTEGSPYMERDEYDYLQDEVINLLTPIELPSDEKYKSYWEKRCELAENYINESPCDPDITNDQLKAYNQWQEFINQNK